MTVNVGDGYVLDSVQKKATAVRPNRSIAWLRNSFCNESGTADEGMSVSI